MSGTLQKKVGESLQALKMPLIDYINGLRAYLNIAGLEEYSADVEDLSTELVNEAAKINQNMDGSFAAGLTCAFANTALYCYIMFFAGFYQSEFYAYPFAHFILIFSIWTFALNVAVFIKSLIGNHTGISHYLVAIYFCLVFFGSYYYVSRPSQLHIQYTLEKIRHIYFWVIAVAASPIVLTSLVGLRILLTAQIKRIILVLRFDKRVDRLSWAIEHRLNATKSKK